MEGRGGNKGSKFPFLLWESEGRVAEDMFLGTARRLEGEGKWDFHLRVEKKKTKPSEGRLTIRDVKDGVKDCHRGGDCSSCDPELSLGQLLESIVSSPLRLIPNRLLLLRDLRLCRVWLDAKARPMIILTPRRHVERLSELSAEECRDLFLDLADATKDVADKVGAAALEKVVVNHGRAQNHPHLHFKVALSRKGFEEYVLEMPIEQREQYGKVVAEVARAKKRGEIGKK